MVIDTANLPVTAHRAIKTRIKGWRWEDKKTGKVTIYKPAECPYILADMAVNFRLWNLLCDMLYTDYKVDNMSMDDIKKKYSPFPLQKWWTGYKASADGLWGKSGNSESSNETIKRFGTVVLDKWAKAKYVEGKKLEAKVAIKPNEETDKLKWMLVEKEFPKPKKAGSLSSTTFPGAGVTKLKVYRCDSGKLPNVINRDPDGKFGDFYSLGIMSRKYIPLTGSIGAYVHENIYLNFIKKYSISKICSITITSKNGEFYTSIIGEYTTTIAKHPRSDVSVGIDVGVKKNFQLSDGKLYHWVKELDANTKKRMLRRQRTLSRKLLLGNLAQSKRYTRELNRFNKRIESIQASQIERINVACTKIANDNGTIFVEELQIKNMMARRGRRKLNQSMASVAAFKAKSILKTKCAFVGSTVIDVNPRYTSITCNKCGCRDKRNRASQSVFKCVSCGHTKNADVNAAENIHDDGKKSVSTGTIKIKKKKISSGGMKKISVAKAAKKTKNAKTQTSAGTAKAYVAAGQIIVTPKVKRQKRQACIKSGEHTLVAVKCDLGAIKCQTDSPNCVRVGTINIASGDVMGLARTPARFTKAVTNQGVTSTAKSRRRIEVKKSETRSRKVSALGDVGSE